MEMGIRIIASPSLHEIKDALPRYVWDEIDFKFRSGRSVNSYLRKELKEDDSEYSSLIKEYLSESEGFHNLAEGHAVTTHKMLPSIDTSKYDLVIVDEDIIFCSIIQNKTDIPLSDLKKLKEKIALGSAISKKIERVIKRSEKDERFFTLQAIDYDSTFAE
jgi:hypothetical protein